MPVWSWWAVPFVVFVGVIGWRRFRRGRPAGARTPSGGREPGWAWWDYLALTGAGLSAGVFLIGFLLHGRLGEITGRLWEDILTR